MGNKLEISAEKNRNLPDLSKYEQKEEGKNTPNRKLPPTPGVQNKRIESLRIMRDESKTDLYKVHMASGILFRSQKDVSSSIDDIWGLGILSIGESQLLDLMDQVIVAISIFDYNGKDDLLSLNKKLRTDDAKETFSKDDQNKLLFELKKNLELFKMSARKKAEEEKNPILAKIPVIAISGEKFLTKVVSSTKGFDAKFSLEVILGDLKEFEKSTSILEDFPTEKVFLEIRKKLTEAAIVGENKLVSLEKETVDFIVKELGKVIDPFNNSLMKDGMDYEGFFKDVKDEKLVEEVAEEVEEKANEEELEEELEEEEELLEEEKVEEEPLEEEKLEEEKLEEEKVEEELLEEEELEEEEVV